MKDIVDANEHLFTVCRKPTEKGCSNVSQKAEQN